MLGPAGPGLVGPLFSHSSAWATEHRSVALVALLVALPPILTAPLMQAVGLDLPVLAWLDANEVVSRTEAPVVAGHIVRPLEDFIAWAPGLVALWAYRRRSSWRSDPHPPSPILSTAVAGCLTLLVAGVLHVLFDLPTGEIARPEVIARVSMQTRLVDVAVNSFGPGILEEFYYRQAMFLLLRRTFAARYAIPATALAFAACHPLALIPWAFLFGLFCGVVRERYGHVGPTMAIHTLWNGVAYADAWLLL